MRWLKSSNMCAPVRGRRWRSNIDAELLADLNEAARLHGCTKGALIRDGVALLVASLSPEERGRLEAIIRSQRAQAAAARWQRAAACRGRKVDAGPDADR
jgi:hypothetical protein